MKKQIPLVILKKLDDLLKKNSNLIYSEKQTNGMIVFKDKDPFSDFYFMIEKINVAANDTASYTINFKPSTQNHLANKRTTASLQNTQAYLESWIKLLNQYNQESILFEGDPITKAYYDEIEPMFDIIDEDADVKPFKHSQQKQLIGIYDKIIQEVLDNTDDENKAESNALIKELEASRKIIPKSTKRQAINHLRRAYAAIKKFSFSVFEKSAVKYLADLLGEIDLKNLF